MLIYTNPLPLSFSTMSVLILKFENAPNSSCDLSLSSITLFIGANSLTELTMSPAIKSFSFFGDFFLIFFSFFSTLFSVSWSDSFSFLVFLGVLLVFSFFFCFLGVTSLLSLSSVSSGCLLVFSLFFFLLFFSFGDSVPFILVVSSEDSRLLFSNLLFLLGSSSSKTSFDFLSFRFLSFFSFFESFYI